MNKVFVLLLSGLGLSGMGLASAQTLKPFTVAKLPFTVSVPQGWLGFDAGDQALGINMISGKTAPATTIRLLYTPKKGTVDLSKQFASLEAGLKATGATFKQVSNSAVTYGGLRGTQREYSLKQGNKSGKLRLWFAQDAKNVYTFEMTDNDARYPASTKLFARMMATLKFKP